MHRLLRGCLTCWITSSTFGIFAIMTAALLTQWMATDTSTAQLSVSVYLDQLHSCILSDQWQAWHSALLCHPPCRAEAVVTSIYQVTVT